MSDHLTGCDFPADPQCICDRLRAAEQRVRDNPDWTNPVLLDELEKCLAISRKEWESEIRPGVVSVADMREGCAFAYRFGVKAAREAIAGLLTEDDYGLHELGLRDALTAIDGITP